jgi:hypothetical protein
LLSASTLTTSISLINQKMKKLLFIIIILNLVLYASGQSNCNGSQLIDKFYKIKKNMSYEDVKLLFAKDGDNYRIDNNGEKSRTYFYKWNFCAKDYYELDCWFRDNKIILAKCNFHRAQKDGKVLQSAFSKVMPEMGYEDICILLGSNGKKFRVDFDGNNTTSFYYWLGKENNQGVRYEVWFNNNKMMHKSKMSGDLKKLYEEAHKEN